MKETNRRAVQEYLLKLLDRKDKDCVRKTMETFSVSRSTVYNYISELTAQGVIEKTGDGCRLAVGTAEFLYQTDEKLQEDRIFSRDILPYLETFPDNVQRMWQYAFTEMMNNAIEHSGAKTIRVRIEQNAVHTEICIADDGVGIFENIRAYVERVKKEEITLKEASSLLLAGKFTTDHSHHSGEGIFFTSHLMDRFVISSDRTVFSRDSFDDRQTEHTRDEKGTTVKMSLSNHSKKELREVFNRFSDDDYEFTKTSIPVAHMFACDPVSRSEARRLCEMLTPFRQATLDFSGVEFIGQAFAHEIFAVFQSQNPEFVLMVENAGEAVEKMIRRAKSALRQM